MKILPMLNVLQLKIKSVEICIDQCHPCSMIETCIYWVDGKVMSFWLRHPDQTDK
ncbi:MAG: hypothetical protein QX196_02675 [Methylococcaceae bacterium]